MASLAAAESSHFARLDYAYQKELDDYSEAVIQLERDFETITTLQDIFDAGWEPMLLQSRSVPGFDFYDIGYGYEVFVCTDCGGIVETPKVCEHCGFSVSEDDQ